MNNFFLLLGDEIRGFIKSKIMLALWIGMPVLMILLYFINPDTEGIPLTLFSGIIISSIGGLLAAVILSTTIVNEKNNNVYDLFLIRPVKRWNILLAKYMAVIICLTIATILSFAVGLVIDSFTNALPSGAVLLQFLESIVMAVAAMSISCVMGILIGLLVKSVALAAILAIYLGQQLSVVAVLPTIFVPSVSSYVFSIGIGLTVTILVLIIDMIIFSKKQF
ncbi:MAG: ABC transporter permease [Asgard group archaeon]|nr:ABC transporter permease [Asgard group archaeon]